MDHKEGGRIYEQTDERMYYGRTYEEHQQDGRMDHGWPTAKRNGLKGRRINRRTAANRKLRPLDLRQKES